jgi:hypothetical protein
MQNYTIQQETVIISFVSINLYVFIKIMAIVSQQL